MFNWLKTGPAAPQPERPLPRIPTGDRIYAIGDIHGRRDLLERLLTLIEVDLEGWTGDSRIVFLGDYIDRGPDSKGVIERLMQPMPCNLPSIFLRGNHEEALLKFLTKIGAGRGWLTYGGLNFLVSYGIPFKGDTLNSESLTALQRELVARFPEAHRQFLADMPSFYSSGDYYFVHAGVHPEVPLDQQSDSDRLWIREPFLAWQTPLEKVIVHGHSISETVEMLPHRIGVDTGAYASGHLSALILEADTRRIIQT